METSQGRDGCHKSLQPAGGSGPLEGTRGQRKVMEDTDLTGSTGLPDNSSGLKIGIC